MYAKNLTTATGLCLLFFAACTSAHKAGSLHPAVISSDELLLSTQKNIAVSAPRYRSAAVAGITIKSKIIEKGGRYVFIPPAFTMTRPEKGTDTYTIETLQQKIRAIKEFAAHNNYNTGVAFFIDMQVKSGKDRFLVVNLANNTIIKKGLVAHGKGNEKFTFNRKFSNDEGSNCTSLGVYRIGKAYNGAFGLSYKLAGLNKTNNNALKRYVVLHAMGSIPYAESKWPITQTEGCPAVAPAFLEELAPILDGAEKNILLCIYSSTTH